MATTLADALAGGAAVGVERAVATVPAIEGSALAVGTTGGAVATSVATAMGAGFFTNTPCDHATYPAPPRSRTPRAPSETTSTPLPPPASFFAAGAAGPGFGATGGGAAGTAGATPGFAGAATGAGAMGAGAAGPGAFSGACGAWGVGGVGGVGGACGGADAWPI